MFRLTAQWQGSGGPVGATELGLRTLTTNNKSDCLRNTAPARASVAHLPSHPPTCAVRALKTGANTLFFLFRPLELWPCPSSCGPALTVFRSCPSSFCRTSTGHSFSHQSLLQEKTNFLKLFRNCLNNVKLTPVYICVLFLV